jgi:hypothetical protein
MSILISVFVIGLDFQGTSLDSLEGRWTIALSMSSLVIPSQYSVLWRPFKTVMIAIENNGSPVNHGRRRGYSKYDDESWSASADIGFHKYYRANRSFSPFAHLSPGLTICGGKHWESGEWYENSYQYYRLTLGAGGEYFFKLAQKQLGLKLRGSLVTLSRRYSQRRYSDSEDSSYVEDNVLFRLPTGGSLQTWLCFHF